MLDKLRMMGKGDLKYERELRKAEERRVTFFICGMCHFLAKPQSSGGEVAFILQLCISNQQSAIHVNLPEDSYFCLLALTSNVQRLIVLAMFCICSCLHQPRQAEWDQMEVCTFCD